MFKENKYKNQAHNWNRLLKHPPSDPGVPKVAQQSKQDMAAVSN